MRIVHVNLPKTHSLVLFGDTHYGARSFNKKVVDAVTKRVNSSSNIFAWHMGDVAEAIAIDDKRYHRQEHGYTLPDPLLQYQAARNDFRKINRLLGILEGNHDRKLNKYGDFIQTMLCDPETGLKQPNGSPVTYGTYSTKLHVHVGDLTYKLFLWHGAGKPPASMAKDPTQRIANYQAAIIRKLAQQHSDCHVMAMGHYHRLMAFRPPPETAIYDDGKRLREDRGARDSFMNVDEFQGVRHIDPNLRWYTVTGCAKKSREAFTGDESDAYSSWEESMGMPPSDLGWSEVQFNRGKLRVVPVFYEGTKTR